MLPSQQQARKASPVVDVQDPKEFKKLLKTTPNVLCLFVKSAGVAKEMKRVVGLTAEQVKGVGSVFYVDCSGYVYGSAAQGWRRCHFTVFRRVSYGSHGLEDIRYLI